MTTNRYLPHTLALVLLPLLILPGGCGSTGNEMDDAGIEIISLQTAERAREYYLYSPDNTLSDAGNRALVLVMHGGGGTAQFAVNEIGETLLPLADKNGFYVVFPQAVNKIWDFGSGRVSEQLEERIDDRGYFVALLDDVTSRLPIDVGRIFVTGISRGGQATYYMACEFPERIRAIAPVAMPLPLHLENTCRSGISIGVAIMNGTNDPLVPYDGGSIEIGDTIRDEVLSTDDTVALWADRNGCNLAAGVETEIDPVQDQVLVRKTEWRSCSGAPVILYSLEGGGHTWPSGRQYLPQFIIGKVGRDIDGATEAWNFFSEFD